MVDVIHLSHVSEKEANEINDLLEQLTGAKSELSPDDINARISAIRLFGAIEDGKIVGMATLVTFHALTGKRARLEDVVVSNKYRRRGIGTSMCEKTISVANGQNVVAIDLTSTPSRKAANALYKSIGFVQGKTNVYRLTL